MIDIRITPRGTVLRNGRATNLHDLIRVAAGRPETVYRRAIAEPAR